MDKDRGDGSGGDKAAPNAGADGATAQMELAKNVCLLVGACAVLYFLGTLLKRCWAWGCGSLDEPDDSAGAAYSPVSVLDAETADHGVSMSTFNPVRHSHSHNSRGSIMQAEDEDEDEEGWGEGGSGDHDLDTAIALSLSEAQSRPPSHPAPQRIQHTPTQQQEAYNDDGDDDDDWDDGFDQVDAPAASRESPPVAQPAYQAENGDFEESTATSRGSKIGRGGREEENFLGAVMSGQDFELPVPGHGGKMVNPSIGSGERSGRFQKKGPATPGTTSQAGVKVIKGMSLKEAFSKNKK